MLSLIKDSSVVTQFVAISINADFIITLILRYSGLLFNSKFSSPFQDILETDLTKK